MLEDTATRDAFRATVIEALRRGVGGIVDDSALSGWNPPRLAKAARKAKAR